MCGYCHAFLPRLPSQYALSKSAKAHLSQCAHAPAKVTLMQNMRQIMTSEGLRAPTANADVCQSFGRKISLEHFRPSAKELKELTAKQAQSSSPRICRPSASRNCAMHGSQTAQGAKRRGPPPAQGRTRPPVVDGRFRFALKPAPQDGGWVRDLTEENIEPHPGPSAGSMHRLRLATWNSQGHQNIFDALAAQLFRDVDAVMLQEVNLSSTKRKDLIGRGRSGLPLVLLRVHRGGRQCRPCTAPGRACHTG